MGLDEGSWATLGELPQSQPDDGLGLHAEQDCLKAQF
jgi:hypothetical protein